MADPKTPPVEVANMAAVIERAAADLALGEEPSRFVAALEEAAPPEGQADDA